MRPLDNCNYISKLKIVNSYVGDYCIYCIYKEKFASNFGELLCDFLQRAYSFLSVLKFLTELPHIVLIVAPMRMKCHLSAGPAALLQSLEFFGHNF